MNEKRLWTWVLVASLVALLIGFGAAWAVQQQRIATAEKALASALDRAALAEQDRAETSKALDAAIAERDRLELAARDAAAAAAGASSTSTAAAGGSTKPSLQAGRGHRAVLRLPQTLLEAG